MNSIKKNSKESLKYSTCIDVFWVHVFLKKNSWRISGTINKIQWKYYGNAWTFPLVPIHRRGFSLFSACPSARCSCTPGKLKVPVHVFHVELFFLSSWSYYCLRSAGIKFSLAGKEIIHIKSKYLLHIHVLYFVKCA